MNPIYFELVAKLGIDLALLVIKNLGKATTNEEAIKALESIKSSQEYIEEDARLRGVPVVPLPS
jgi:predicted phosphoribosyltransferase